MALDMYIDMGDKIKGESRDRDQKDNIDVLAWSWGLSQTGSFHIGGGGGAGRANFQDFSFTKYIDKASPALQQHCAGGTHIPKVKFLARKAGKTPQKYLEITLDKVIVAGVATGGSNGEERLTENVTLNFAKVTYEYFLQKDDGSTASGGKYTYDIEAHAED